MRQWLNTLPAGIPVTEYKIEKDLVDRLYTSESDSDCLEALWELGWFYSQIQRRDLAEGLIKIIVEHTDDLERRAHCYLLLGGGAEAKRRYDAAIEYYLKGLALNPKEKFVAYFLNNNVAYCLNLQGKHAEAERYCRTAIAVESERGNAFKNLGLAFAGQGNVLAAAWAWIEAIKANAQDVRPLHFLVQLMLEHPELDSQFTGIHKELEDCQEAMEAAFRQATDRFSEADYDEICRLKLIPGKGYLLLQDGEEKPISAEAIEQFYTVQALVQLDLHANTWVSILRASQKKNSQARRERPVKPSNYKSRSDYLGWLGSLYPPCFIFQDAAVERVKHN